MTESFETFNPQSDDCLTKEETEVFNQIFETNYESIKCKSSSKSSKSSSSFVKDTHNDHKDHKPFYDCSYNTILFAIIVTIIFLIFACPAVGIWFSYYVPDPYFNLITRALIFFILVFFFDLVLCYYSCRNHDNK